MNFEEAESKFRELQARVQRGEAISRAEYEDQVSQLAVQDRNGVLWEINPRTGKWMYFDGAEWVSGTPPGHDTSAVIPNPLKAPPPPSAIQPPPPPIAPTTPPPARPVSPPVPPRPVAPPTASTAAPSRTSPETLKPYVRPQDRKATPPPTPAGGPPGSPPAGRSPLAMFGPNREWIPLAIGAVILLFCAVLLFVGGNFALGALGGTKPTPTRTLVPTLPATPVPTVVRLPTLPPPTATPQPVLAKVIERKVNVRSGPSTKDKIISSLKRDDQITLVGRNAEGTWYQINIAGAAEPAWVFGETLEIAGGDPNTLPVPGAAPAVQPTPTLLPLGTQPTPTKQP